MGLEGMIILTLFWGIAQEKAQYLIPHLFAQVWSPVMMCAGSGEVNRRG